MSKSDKKERMSGWKKNLDNIMVKGSGFMTTLDVGSRACAVCKSFENLQRCSHCMKVSYCSRDCQRADWRAHKNECQATVAKAKEKKAQASAASKTPTAAAATNEMPVACSKCGARSEELKTCGRCGEVKYCSRDCQLQDWQKHKESCKKLNKKPESDWEAGKMFEDLVKAMDPNFSHPKRRSRNLALSWEDAIKKCIALHPDKVVITDLREVTLETDLDPIQMTSTVFLARLARPHLYVVRNAWYLEDRRGKEVRIFFYLDNNVSEPYFKFSQLDRGNYLCLEHAYIHTFLDGTSGIRVDDACDVSIIGN